MKAIFFFVAKLSFALHTHAMEAQTPILVTCPSLDELCVDFSKRIDIEAFIKDGFNWRIYNMSQMPDKSVPILMSYTAPNVFVKLHCYYTEALGSSFNLVLQISTKDFAVTAVPNIRKNTALKKTFEEEVIDGLDLCPGPKKFSLYPKGLDLNRLKGICAYKDQVEFLLTPKTLVSNQK